MSLAETNEQGNRYVECAHCGETVGTYYVTCPYCGYRLVDAKQAVMDGLTW